MRSVHRIYENKGLLTQRAEAGSVPIAGFARLEGIFLPIPFRETAGF
jgi:hypothetical protein